MRVGTRRKGRAPQARRRNGLARSASRERPAAGKEGERCAESRSSEAHAECAGAHASAVRSPVPLVPRALARTVRAEVAVTLP